MILSEADAAAEMEAVEPIDLQDAGQATFEYLRLGDEDFECLLYALARISAPEGIERTWDGATLMVLVGAGDPIHNYPEEWERYYDRKQLGRTDPVHRACRMTLVRFTWSQLPKMIPLSRRASSYYEHGPHFPM